MVKDNDSIDGPFYKYQIMIRYKNANELRKSFTKIRKDGVFEGVHGNIVDLVENFHFEFYKSVTYNIDRKMELSWQEN